MSTTTAKKHKTWSEINKEKKEEKRKWKEVNLEKKFKKLKKNDEETENETTPTITIESAQNNEEISTISIAIPGSILENAQSLELRTYLAGQIARAACIFQVDEIIIFDDFGDEAKAKKSTLQDNYELKSLRESCVQFGRILQFLECPQYLRKHFFPIHKDLKFAGVLNPLGAPHHLGKNDNFTYREGVVTNKPVKPGKGSLVNIGLLQDVVIDKLLTPGIRCTVKLLPNQENKKTLKGIVVSPTLPRLETGIYWGYTIRLENSLNQVFKNSPYKNGYDVTVGTSDKGTSVDEFTCPGYQHLMIMFGGLNGLEAALENDPVLTEDDPKLLFDYYLNTIPEQGTKTVRTEEAVLISLAALRNKLNPKNKPRSFNSTISNQLESNNASVVEDNFDRFD